ncbi:MAG: serine hydroxymethyltransferase [Kiritimatiellae bacterium]|nr:serine hydroxymethyltransferase [Kiritimatiellia bacterium]
MKIAFGCDHGGFPLKEATIAALKTYPEVEVEDLGTFDRDPVDYSDYAIDVAEKIAEGAVERGVLICTTGIGMAIAANRFYGVRAALCEDAGDATKSRAHNDSNVLVLPCIHVKPEGVQAIVDAWMKTEYTGRTIDGMRHARRLAKLDTAKRLSELACLAGVDPEVHAAIRRHTEQEDATVNLIASENYTSRAVREATGSILTNKYSEGYPGRRWYGGCSHIDEVERLAIERAKQLFGAEHANVQPHCGASANMAVYLAALEPGDTILSMSLDQGGHLSHGSKFNISGKLYNIESYTVSKETETLDYEAIAAKAREVKPRLILAGASAYPRAIDFAKFREIADSVGAMLLVDMAHIAGLVAGGAHASPVPYADFVTSTTHKTLRGPRGGLILCKEKYAKAIDRAVFPGLQGGPLENVIAGKAVCFKEALQPEFAQYAAQIVANSKRLAAHLLTNGFRLVSGGTDNHLVLVDMAASGLNGKVAQEALDEAGIICNKNAIPYDTLPTSVTSGIRLGTASVTTRGLKEADMLKVAGWISKILANIGDTNLRKRIRGDVIDFMAQFQTP